MPGVKDRVAVVTGAANGLGREIARVLAREGAKVALGDLDAAGVERTAAEINARAAGTGAPDGAAIDPLTGVFTWTPTEAQGPQTYTVTVRVIDSTLPAATDARRFRSP